MCGVIILQLHDDFIHLGNGAVRVQSCFFHVLWKRKWLVLNNRDQRTDHAEDTPTSVSDNIGSIYRDRSTKSRTFGKSVFSAILWLSESTKLRNLFSEGVLLAIIRSAIPSQLGWKSGFIHAIEPCCKSYKRRRWSLWCADSHEEYECHSIQ